MVLKDAGNIVKYVSCCPAILLDGQLAPSVRDVRGKDGCVHSITRRETGWQDLDDLPQAGEEIELRADDQTSWSAVRLGNWAGRVTSYNSGQIVGWARDDLSPDSPVTVVALSTDGTIVGCAVTQPDTSTPELFTLKLPASYSHAVRVERLFVVISGSDFVLQEGRVSVGAGLGWPAPAHVQHMSRSEPLIAIKISTPNLKEAPLWGDYHFANSLAASFAKIGLQARVDTQDSWYSASNNSDIDLTIRGRHRLKLDPGKINMMWMISHPDRIPDAEFSGYDHVAVASDIYARALREAGLAEARVLHQATDARLFGAHVQNDARMHACLFVGNSRREYRTMVKWCIQKNVPLELYGGGWEGILPHGSVRAQSVANTDLAEYYGKHLLLLNDHWDSMRGNGFLSNRLFDGSATGTPILTDPVAGLEDVFGDTISQANEAEDFTSKINDCLQNPDAWLARAARARKIVLEAHTFDHRAVELAQIMGLSDTKNAVVAYQVSNAASHKIIATTRFGDT